MIMKPYNSFCRLLSDPKTRSCLCIIFVAISLICGAYISCGAWLQKDYFSLSLGIRFNSTPLYSVKCETPTPDIERVDKCSAECKSAGTEALPRGIVSTTTDLEMRPLTGPITEKYTESKNTSLLGMAVGITQKEMVNRIVEKFLGEDFVVMLFHYDGIVDEWNDMDWNDRVVHVSAKNQTKWWFAKRFLHPDIVAEYEYIFLWDEDLGVENFHPGRYMTIVREEGLEISQPALEPGKSEVHHLITVRQRRSKVHRRYYSSRGGLRCDGNSTAPPCVGWVEMMAPVFSRSAWRCVWYMIQNDLIHAWGLDMKLGYCSQGDRTVKVGVVDEEYIVHHGLPTLGGNSNNNTAISSESKNASQRSAVRLRSSDEMKALGDRWNKAVEEDECWVDPFGETTQF